MLMFYLGFREEQYQDDTPPDQRNFCSMTSRASESTRTVALPDAVGDPSLRYLIICFVDTFLLFDFSLPVVLLSLQYCTINNRNIER